jgi:hypothetical protein
LGQKEYTPIKKVDHKAAIVKPLFPNECP